MAVNKTLMLIQQKDAHSAKTKITVRQFALKKKGQIRCVFKEATVCGFAHAHGDNVE